MRQVNHRFDTGTWVCTVSATAYLDRVVFSDALESKAANLSVFGKNMS